ncbi:MAG: RNase adapter RapZ [Solirubrobacterales bacterium]|nr:RNase adapter RapZ [Solirubrobacterales bacterium]
MSTPLARLLRSGRRDVPEGTAGRTSLEDLVIITGFSGAGKSTAMNVFEDAGYFCVDSKVEHAAVVSDVRGGDYFEALDAVINELVAAGVRHRVLFLDADEQTLIDRYKETRRRHPLAPESNIAAGIAAERELLQPLRERADLVVDSTGLKAAHLRRRIVEELLPRRAAATRMALTFQSFGFKHGPPRQADLVLDCRFLPNPHYVPDLRPLTGLDPRIVEYVSREGTLDEFYAHLLPMLDFLVPQYQQEGKAHLVIAMGCTGGRHRSVAIAEHLAAHFRDRDDVVVEVEHRDVGRGALG